MEEERDGVRELFWAEGEDGVGATSASEESSSSPMAKAVLSSGTLLREGVRADCGDRMLSTELVRDVCVGLVGGSEDSAASFLRCFMRCISSWPLSRVKERRASKRLRDLKIPWIKTLLSYLMSSV